MFGFSRLEGIKEIQGGKKKFLFVNVVPIMHFICGLWSTSNEFAVNRFLTPEGYIN
jgi:hypothetical protein